MKPFATAFVLMVAGILIIGATDAPPKQVNASPAPPDNSAELAALRAENADLRQQLSVTPPTIAKPAVDEPPTVADRLLDGTNTYRVYPVKESSLLTNCAQSHADFLAANNYRGSGGHTFDGREPYQRAQAAGFYGHCNEILGCGYRTPEQMIRGWATRDSDHYKVLQGSEYDVAGFGHSVNGHGEPIWVGLFGQQQAHGHQHQQAPVKAQVSAVCGPGGCGTSSTVRASARPAVRFTSRARGFRLLPRNRK